MKTKWYNVTNWRYILEPDPVKLETFNIDTSSRVVTWTSPPFPGDDLKYSVSLEDALKGGVLSRSTTSGIFLKFKFFCRYCSISLMKIYKIHTAFLLVSSFNLPSRLYNYYNYTVVVVAHTSAGTATPIQYPFTTLHAGSKKYFHNLKKNRAMI